MAGSLRGVEQVLIVGDEPRRSGTIAAALHARDVVPCLAFTPAQAIRCTGLYDFRLVVVDSFADGATPALARSLRARTEAPLVVVAPTASTALESAADCVLPPTAGVDEVVARSLALLAISRPPDLPATLTWGPLELDVTRRLARWYLKPLRLTSIQFRMMEVLVLAGGSIVSTRDLARRVWGTAIVEDEDRIRAHVWRIRKLIERRPSAPEFLLTVRGEGFRLEDSDAPAPDVDLRPFDGGRRNGALIN